MDLYALVAPFLLAGAVAFFLPIASVWVRPRWKKAFVAGWAASSFFIGSALCIDQLTIQEGSLVEGLAWAGGATGGLALLTALLYWRLHMWDLIDAMERKRGEEEAIARYRPKHFEE